MNEMIINTKSIAIIKERASRLAESINEARDRGIVVAPHDPIEGKMFWSEKE